MSERIADAFLCTQCGGELHPDEGQVFLSCPYCGSTVYLDKSRVVFHWYLAPTLDGERARAALARWMAGNETVKDLDRKSQIVGQAFRYFPLWFFKRRQPNGKEEALLEPAAATSVSELKHLSLTAGDLRKYDEALDPEVEAPTVPLQAALDWLRQRDGIQREEIVESALVHMPLHLFKYTYSGQQYTAVVEGATGRVMANLYPAKAEAPYQLVGVLAAGIFLLLAAIPPLGALVDGIEGMGVGMLVCAGLGLPAALILFGLAAWVASRV